MTPREEIQSEVEQDLTDLGILTNDNSGKINVYFKQAINFIIDFCNNDFTEEVELDSFPSTLVTVIEEMIILKLNKQGFEGKLSEKIGKYSVGFSEEMLPKSILSQLYRHRRLIG